ncbi:LrgB family protein [Paenibacillus aurantius]|uniref:LrgB family protein n=1 Tax=Paenibacillus aurantius TaxID=2918900 RepID=A0AA96L9R1_9BACL|nr:LrgB family protein [Paenibacillus aurantius]WNQ09143.1 LrgB family protein [Paenibacillus aurantius]
MSSFEWLNRPEFGVTVTVAAYVTARRLHLRWSRLHPLFVTAGALILFLIVTGIPYEAYKAGGDVIYFFLGPGTVALGVPLYKHATRIRQSLVPVLAGITVGTVASILFSALLVWMLGGTRELLLSILPKSASTPIAIEVVRTLGGTPELGAVITSLTGLLGSMIGPEFLRLCGVRSDVAIGTAIGTASHGIGTARLVRESELQASMSSLAMGIAGILTSLLLGTLSGWI